MCLTMWNAFYSLLWGFSGGMMYDLYNDPRCCDRERLIRSYAATAGVDRILARRLPNLERGGWVNIESQTRCGCGRRAASSRSARWRRSRCSRSGWAGA